MECELCNQDMLQSKGCSEEKKIKFKNKPDKKPVRAAEGEDFVQGRCHDCAAVEGEFHHPGCDMERCPSCGDQFITCGCVAVAV